MSRWASLIANDNVYKEILRGYHELMMIDYRECREEDIHWTTIYGSRAGIWEDLGNIFLQQKLILILLIIIKSLLGYLFFFYKSFDKWDFLSLEWRENIGIDYWYWYWFLVCDKGCCEKTMIFLDTSWHSLILFDIPWYLLIFFGIPWDSLVFLSSDWDEQPYL